MAGAGDRDVGEAGFGVVDVSGQRVTLLVRLFLVHRLGEVLADADGGPFSALGLVGGWRRTACSGSIALLLCVTLGCCNHMFEARRGYMAIGSIAGVTTAGIVAAVMRQQREAEPAGVRSIAEAAQRVLLKPMPRMAGPRRAAVSYASAVAARIGGGLYEVVASPHGVRVIVGDVQGKGGVRVPDEGGGDHTAV